MNDPLRHYRKVWLCDFEFRQPAGERPEPICMVAREYRSGQTIRVWVDDLAQMVRPPFPIAIDTLLVAYYASAELSCFLALDWPMPVRVLDLFCEFRNLTNGGATVAGNGLLGALAYFGLGGIDGAEKTEMRELAQRGGHYTSSERKSLLAYCETDVTALAKLLPVMLPRIDLPRALLRGRYMVAVAAMEWNGVPVDVVTLDTLRATWGAVKGRLVERIDADFDVYVPTGRELNPESTLGAEVLQAAENWGLDPYMLAETVDQVWAEERAAVAEQAEALKAARRRTGATADRIARWENLGEDHSTWAGFDVAARELAGQYPALGLGRGFEAGAGFDDTDYSGPLWSLLREGAPPPKPKHQPDILTQAAELVAQAGPTCRVVSGGQRLSHFGGRN
ncbi:MAG: hypothetical protein ABIK89_25125 [Planctomycetota bacterium]